MQKVAKDRMKRICPEIIIIIICLGSMKFLLQVNQPKCIPRATQKQFTCFLSLRVFNQNHGRSLFCLSIICVLYCRRYCFTIVFALHHIAANRLYDKWIMP